MIWLSRAALLTLLILTLGWKLAAPPPLKQAGDLASDLAGVLGRRLAGPIASQPWGREVILSAPVAGCKGPLIVAPSLPTFSEEEALTAFQPAGGHHLFVYLDWMSDHADRWGLLRRHIRENLESIIGVSLYRLPDTMLFVAEPAGCGISRTLPWRRFWLKP